jgi:hypothetical protein
MSIGISSSSGDNTGINTGDPQSIGQTSTLQTGSSNLQSPVNPDSVANSSIVIPLNNFQTTTISSPIKITSKEAHHVSSVVFIPIGVLVIIAVLSCAYIYITSKKPNKYA